MLMMSSPRKRNSRWDHRPVLDAAGDPRHACITERDIEGIFRPLARYRYLPANYIHAFYGGSLDYLINRLGLLCREPNRYVSRPAQQRANSAANYRRLIYELSEKGWALMRELGTNREHARAIANFNHDLTTCQLMASIEIGAREANVHLITWPEILQSNSFPDATRRLPKPTHIPVTITLDAKVHVTHVVADGQPFGIRRTRGDQSAYFFCPGIEADCATEPVDTSDFRRSSIFRKFLLYLAIERESIYRSHFGFPNLYVPIVTTNEARLASMMNLLQRMTGGAGSKSILFQSSLAVGVLRRLAVAPGAIAHRRFTAGRLSAVQFPQVLIGTRNRIGACG